MNKFTGLLSILAIAALVALAAAYPVAARKEMSATPEAESMSMGAAYMVIENTGTTADRLIAGKTAVAETVEIHEIVDVNGVMKMQPLADGLEIPAGGSVELKPGGYHIMLIGLTESLVDGTTYELTLTFAEAGDVTLTVAVYANADMAMAATPTAAVTAGGLSISGVWSRSAPAMGSSTEMSGSSAAAFMTIVNSGTEADTLIAAKTEIAAAAEIHEMKQGEGGVMKMSPLANGLEIPAGGTVSLEPGGYHVMLFGITQDLTPGFTYELTLTFAVAGDVTITVPVQTMATDTATTTPVTVGSITISGQWTRPAPAMNGNGGMATPASGM
ncbi:MAG: copper chaperone PCu(A)C [Thermomicrobiales bacterium]|nr:copper chaperone PCu(A)C [Thermomicrobiales bacterium]